MKKIYLFLILMASGYLSHAQVKIGDNPTSVGTSSALELESTNKALVITRVANTAAITNPVNGMLIYDISSKCVKSYENGAWTNCLSNGSNIEPSTNGTAVVSSYNCATGSTGTLTSGVAVSGVTQTITAVVTQLGTYSLNTFANGVVFSASGTFTSLGSQNVTLSAIGTPVNTGSSTFTLNTIPNCSFARTTQGNPSSGGTAIVSAYTCSTASAGTMQAGTAVSGVTQTISATVTTVGTYNITATANGVVFTGTGTFAGTGVQDVVLTATGTPTTPGSTSFPLSTTPTCSFTRPVNSVSSGGTAVVSAYTCSGASVGTLTVGTAASGVTQVISATVTTVGTYSISIPAVNGISWSGSGTFAGTGSQNITLTASGTPVTAGTSTFPLPTTPTCSFTRSVGLAFSTSICASSTSNTFPQVATVGSYSVTTTRTGTSSNLTNEAVCGLNFSGTSNSLSGNQFSTYAFSIPLQNMQFFGWGDQTTGEGYSVTASLAGVSVPVQLVPFGGSCIGDYSVSQSGNAGVAQLPGGTSSPTNISGILFNISSAGPYDQITITRLNVATTNVHSLIYCNATAFPNSTSGGSAVISAYNCSGASNGTLTVGTAASGVTQTITATVTTAGGYNISIPAVNGVSWTGSGIFSGTGAQTITLTASGTPTTAGTSTFALPGSPTCSFTRSVTPAFTSTVCTTNVGSYPTTQNIGGTNVTINKTTSTDTGTATFSTTICSTAITGQGVGLLNSNAATYTFSVPVRNVQVSISASDELNEGISVSASLVGVAVPVQVIPFGGSCTTGYSTAQSGNTGSAYATGSSAPSVILNISTTNAYDTITITRIAAANGSNAHGLMFCNATAVPSTSNGTAVFSAITCNTASAGSMVANSAVSGVTQTITATVTTPGTYNIATNTVNGVTFSGSGTVSGTGPQTIVLTASGTPTSATASPYTYTLNTSPNCTFTRTVSNQPSSNGTAIVSAYNCATLSAGTLTAGKVVSGVTQTITATVTTVGTYNISIPAVNGVSWSASGTFAGTGAQNIPLVASGTPTVEGCYTYTLNVTPNCSFTRFVNGDGSTSAKASLSCKQIKTDYPAATDGQYWIDIDGCSNTYAAMQAYCDMTTDGGGWTLVKNYNHGAATTPALNDARTTFPTIVNLNAISAGEASDATAWGGMPVAVINLLNTTGFIVEGRIAGRVLAKKFNSSFVFTTSLADVNSYGNPATALNISANAKVWFTYGTGNCADHSFALDFIWCNPTYRIWSIKQYVPGTCCGSSGGEVNEAAVFRLWVK